LDFTYNIYTRELYIQGTAKKLACKIFQSFPGNRLEFQNEILPTL